MAGEHAAQFISAPPPAPKLTGCPSSTLTDWPELEVTGIQDEFGKGAFTQLAFFNVEKIPAHVPKAPKFAGFALSRR